MRPEKQGEDRAQLAVGLLEEALAEHSFGTIKRAWGYTYTLLRRRPKVSAEFSLIYTVYNMRRNVSLLTPHGLVRALKKLEPGLEVGGICHPNTFFSCYNARKANRSDGRPLEF